MSCYRNRGFKSPAPTKRGGLQEPKQRQRPQGRTAKSERKLKYRLGLEWSPAAGWGSVLLCRIPGEIEELIK